MDEFGRCCGRKPLVYRGRHGNRGFFCDRCCRRYDLDTREWIENWAWKKNQGGQFVATYPWSDYATREKSCDDQPSNVRVVE
jgi:hypothetical protein